jgi:hypothetical protein
MRIQYIILTAIIFFLIRYTHDDRIVKNVIYSIVFAILFWYMMGIYTKSMHEKIAKADNYWGKKVISCGLMSHIRGIIADGGIGYLLSDCLVFVPHKLNFSRKTLTIMLSDIECVSGYRVLGMFDIRLKIRLKSGKVEQFIIDKKEILYGKLLEVNNYLFILIFSGIMISSCNKQDYLEDALKLSGENRSELEKVLHHYKDDALKLEAVQFLIKNMPGHYSFSESDELNRYYAEIDSVYGLYKGFTSDSLIVIYEAIAQKYDISKIETVPDEQYITADYLIHNIEQSFDIWENSPWAQHINFEEFCEYILPYKISEFQILDNWKEYSKDICNGNVDTLKYCSLYENLAVKSCETVNLNLKKLVKPNIIHTERIFPVMKADIALKKLLGTCEEYAWIATTVLRAKGIPTAIDYTPQWPFRSMGHSWNVVLDNFGKNVVFLGCDSKVGIPHKKDHPTAKVFRKIYAVNHEVKEINLTEKCVPEMFSDYHIKDVTEEYMSSVDVEIKLKSKTNFQYAYLAVFDNKNWIPVQFGKIKGNKVTFKKMGKSIVYLPVIYEKNGTVPVANPFILSSNGKYTEIIPDITNKQTLVLDRKYPVLPKVFNISQRILNGKIQASNDPGFKESVTIYTIKELGPKYGEIYTDSIREKYQYWRYLSPNEGHCNIAEIYFFQKDSLQAIYGKVIGTPGVRDNKQTHIKEVTFDNDPLTFNFAPVSSGGWVGQDFGEPISIDKIIYIPRGDGNGVLFGNEYELFYWDKNEWQSLGKKMPSGIELRYENCPADALFLLHNHTSGREERIFTYENGKQVWW